MILSGNNCKMDILTLIIWIIILVIVYMLVDTVSSLQKEIKEMRIKCVKTVYNNDFTKLEENSTKDPKNEMIERFKKIKSYIL